MAPSRAPLTKPRAPRLARSLILLTIAWHLAGTRGVLVAAHEHHHDMEIDDSVPIDWVLYLHIALQLLTWGILLPLGVILGLTRSSYHVPLQSLSSVLTVLGIFLGHRHGGRMFGTSAHEGFGAMLGWYLGMQVVCGGFLKMHVWEGSLVRRTVQIAHGVLGKFFIPIAWTQIVFGFIAMMGFCYGEHVGQCVAHFIMGSAFVGYGVLLLIALHHGRPWLRRHGWSQEFVDSAVLAAWGVINTFTEHGVFFSAPTPWTHKDMQHTTLGVFWAVGGFLSLFLSRAQHRNPLPGMIIFVTGWAFGSHEQSLVYSTYVHRVFGWTLMAAGAAKVVEGCFVRPGRDLDDGGRGADLARDDEGDKGIKAWEHLTPILLTISGTCFMSATEEQLTWISETVHMDHVTYALLQYSTAFLIYLWANLLVYAYSHSGRNAPPTSPSPPSSKDRPSWWRRALHTMASAERGAATGLGGRMNGHAHDGGYEAVPLRPSSSPGEADRERLGGSARRGVGMREGETVWDAERDLEEGEDGGFWHGEEDAKEYA